MAVSWGRWADGVWHRLVPERDHPGAAIKAAQQACRVWAGRNGQLLELRTHETGWSLRLRPKPDPADPVPAVEEPPAEVRPRPRYLAPSAMPVALMTEYQRGAEAYRLSARSLDWITIATELGYNHASDAQRAASEFAASVPSPERALSSAVMLDQIDRAIFRVLEVLDGFHVMLHKGQVVCVPKDPNVKDGEVVVLEDTGPTLAAAGRLNQLLTTKASLLGLNAPTKHEHSLVPLPPQAITWIESKRLEITG